MSLEATNLVWAGSPHRAEHEPGRLGSDSQTVAEISAENQIQDENSRIAIASGNYADLAIDRKHANFAAACVADVTPSTSGALTAATNWAEQIEASESGGDGYTEVKHKRRRRDSPGRPVEQRSNGIATSGRTGATPRSRPPAGRATEVQVIRATRADIADARARQRSSTEDNCVFVEHCLQAVEELVGGAGNVLQVMKMDGHMLVGLSTKALAERLIKYGLDIGHTHLRAFPFKKRVERITVGNLPFFVDDAAVIEALKPYGDVTSIVPIRLRAGRYTFTDGRREAFILLKEGIALEKIPTRVVIRNKGNVLSAFISYGVKCSRCGRQGHRRANCPINPGRASNNGQPQPAPLPPGASSTVSRQQSRPTPAAPALPMEETPSAPPPVTPAPPLQAPEGPVGPRPAGSQHPEPPPARPDLVAPRNPLPAQKTLGPAAPTPDVEMSIVEETFASSTSSAKNATRVDLDAFIERHPSVSFAGTDPLLSPPQGDALAGLIGQILELRPGAATREPYSEHLSELRLSEGDITDAIICPEDREPLLRLSTRRKNILAEIISAAIERARDIHPFGRECMSSSASPGSSGSAGQEPGRPSIPAPTGGRISSENGNQKILKENSENRVYANPPAGVKDVNLAAARDVTLNLPAGMSSNGAARVLGSWADCIEDLSPGAEDDFTVVKTKKRRRESSNSPTAAAPSSNSGGARSSRRLHSSARSVPRAQKIPTTRTHITEARARQASSSEEHCVYLEHGPELQPFHYLRALDRLLGGTAGIIQISKGHRRANCPLLAGLANNTRTAPPTTPAGVPPPTTPAPPQRSAAQPPAPTPSNPAMEVCSAPPVARAALHSSAPRPSPPAAPAFPMEETPPAPPPVTPAPSLQTPGSREPAAPTPDVDMSIVEETLASFTSSAKNATRVDLDAFIEGHPSVSFAKTDALGLGREEVLDLLSSRTKAQRKGPLLSPPQCDALVGLIGQILDLRPGAASNLYKVLGQVKAELRTTPAVPPTPTLPAPWPSKPTPPALHGEKTSPDIATPPPPLSTEFIDACYDQANDIIYELSDERYSEPLSDIGVTEGDIVEAIIFPDDREPLLRRLSTQKRTTLAGIVSAASERARSSDPFVQKLKLCKSARRQPGCNFCRAGRPLAAIPTSNAAAQVRRNWADITEEVNPGAEDGFTLVQSRKRRRGSANSPTAAAPSSNAGGSRTIRRPQPSAGSVPRAQEIRVTRAHIAEARARQASSSEEHCEYIEHSPELEPFHYLRALDRMLGGTAGVIQITKVNGHQLLGLTNRGLAERLISEGFEVEGTLLRAFPFRKRAERITVGNLHFFVGDSAVINALSPYGRVTSIAPKQMKAGPYVYVDGRRDVFITLHEGITIERLPTRLDINIKGQAWPAYLSSGIRCSRCHGQGHRRAICPLLAGLVNNTRMAPPTTPAGVPPPTTSAPPQRSAAQPPAPAPSNLAMEVCSAPPMARAVLHPSAPRPSPPAAPALPMEETPSAPPPVIPAPSLQAPEGSVGPRSANSQHPEPPPARPDFVAPRDPLPAQKILGPAAPTPDVDMSIVEETSASSTSLAKNATRVDLDAFIERHPSCDALAGLIGQILDLRPGAASNLYKVLGQVKAELRTTPAAVPTPSPPRPAETTSPALHGERTSPDIATPPPPLSTQFIDACYDQANDIIYALS
ncbi:hypothetical protein LAZ67_8002455, partial [Cordylochernes scorpioides]